ncbi:predicted protein [Botrytis cinerea T4]|uniref:Uncharacterized protein n=1 Tax=Botryotinia fuckeliana (strain T4) TaxID=999810 RepID=G2XV76_BOTF4|nr:predicted protein [Botrytis cinerea T4]
MDRSAGTKEKADEEKIEAGKRVKEDAGFTKDKMTPGIRDTAATVVEQTARELKGPVVAKLILSTKRNSI